MAETGFVYVPTICQAGAACRVHIALHGCKQSSETIGTDFVRHAGYNEWADANNIIVLYPQAAPSALGDFTMPVNPEGCWDWFGYTNSDYTRKAGRQIGALKAMLDRVTSGANAAHGIIDVSVPTLRNATQIDSSDTAIDLAWSPIAGADAYVVSRAPDQGQALQPLGIVASASFGDAGLLPAHTYRYQVQAVMNGAPGPQSSVVEATTRPTPPRCDEPGLCLVTR
jgi:hypothetical protein